MKREEFDFLADKIIASACFVHRELGPGLLESVYHACLHQELTYRGLKVEREVKIPLYFRQKLLDKDFRIDLLVQNSVIIEVKAIESIAPVHIAQLLSYLKLSDKWLGFLLNFNVPVMKEGIRRMVNGPVR
jgi:GxxExxY protein